MISVCMPTYNGEKFIKDQIDSILMQLSDIDELIVSDDSSSDNTINIIKSYNDIRIRILENNTFRSPIYNLENALKQAKGDFVFLSDQDDIWHPQKVKNMIVALQDYDLVVCNSKLIDEKDNVLKDNYFQHYFKQEKPPLNFLKNLKKNPFLGCAMAFRKSLLKKALPFPKKIAMHDIWIGLLGELTGKVIFLDKPLQYWRRHAGNVTNSIERGENLTNNSFIYKIFYRIQIILSLVLRLLVIKYFKNKVNIKK